MNLCTDQLLLLLVERNRIASLSYFASDPGYSVLADMAAGIPVNRGQADEVITFAPDLILTSQFSATLAANLLERMDSDAISYSLFGNNLVGDDVPGGKVVMFDDREGAEQAADAIRSLAEAKSPTEFIQLQSELARTSFDRAVAETSRLTESMVKLAGKAFQPLSNRATANAERFNNIVA